MRAIPIYCHDCRVMFTIYYTPKSRNKIYCPKCGDNIATKRNPYTTGKQPGKGTMPRWTDDEKLRLRELYITTVLMSREIAAELGKTDKAVRNMISRLKLANI